MPANNDSRPGPCEQALIKKAADRAVEFLEFLSGSEGLAVAKNGRTVTITYTPPDDGGGWDPGDIGIEDVDGLQAALDAKAATSHGHAISDVSGLQTALDGKAATSHTHATSEVTGLDAALAGKAATSHTHAISDTTGLQTALDGKAATSHTHAISDTTGLQTALDGKAATSHTHAISDTTGLQTALDGKAATSHTHAISDTTGLQTSLDGKAATSHTHATSEVTGLDAALAGKAATSHTHATSEVTGLDAALAGKAATSHTHAASDINAGTLDAARIPVATTTTIGGVKRNAGAAGEYLLGFDTDGSSLYGTPVSGYRPALNAIINGDMRVSQRGFSFSALADGSYCADRWFILCETGTLDVGHNYADGYAELYVESNSATSKFGVCQIIENRDLHDMIGKEVTLSFKASLTPNADLGLSAAICVWDNTADVPTHDIVSAWGASGTNPTLVTDWSIINNTVISPGDSTAMTTYTKTVTLPSFVRNIAVFIFVKNKSNVAAGDAFSLTDVQLEIGSAATTFQRPVYADSLARCQRYYEVLRYGSGGQAAISNVYSGAFSTHNWYYKVEKRAVPSVSLVTGSWTTGTPTITPNVDMCYLSRVAGGFNATGTSGAIALAADAEL